jgi:uncharacterized membrane protein
LLYAFGAIAAGVTLPRFELHLLPGLASTISVSAATAMYSSIASGMIALTGIVFSLTFVMAQFSATAYSPRLVLWLARDPLISHALGMFMATFLYALAALSWVDRSPSGVPLVSAIMVLLLLLGSVAVFVGLIQRIARLQINRMLTFTGDQGRRVIDALYPSLDAPATTLDEPALRERSRHQFLVHRERPLAVQGIDVGRLLTLAGTYGAVIEVTTAIGDTLMQSMPVLQVSGSRQPIEEDLLWESIELGEERTFDQDPKYAIRLLADIAIKALSPAVNDPTTAVQALDQIGDLLLRLGNRRLEIGVFRDAAGAVRVVIPYPSWDDFLRLGLDEILLYGATSVQVMRRLNALSSDLIVAVPPERRPALRAWRERFESSIGKHFVDPNERQDASAEDRQGLGGSRPRQAA